jgi:hypothetical protein
VSKFRMWAAVALIVVLLEVLLAEPVPPVSPVVSLDSLLRVEQKSMRSVENNWSQYFI